MKCAPSQRKCYPAELDRDGDGYAGTREKPSVCSERLDNGHRGCPEGSVKYTEPPEHDRFISETQLADGMTVTPDFDFSAIHPNRSEAPFDDIDNDSDGYVDETEYVYRSDSSNVGNDHIDIRFNINRAWVLENVDRIRATAYRLEDLTERDLRSIEHNLEVDKDGISTDIFPPETDGRIPKYIDSRIDGLEPGTVYAIGLTYYSGERVVRSIHGGAEARPRRDRIASDVYFAMTYPDDMDDETSVARTRIVNQALYERDLFQRGLTAAAELIGYDRQDPFIAERMDGGKAFVHGTRYGAEVGEWWCSEFVGWIYRQHLSGGWSHRGTEGFLDEFERADSLLEIDESNKIKWATPGNYVAKWNWAKGLNPENSPGSAMHSAMLLAPSKGNRLWIIQGGGTVNIALTSPGRYERAGDISSAEEAEARRIAEWERKKVEALEEAKRRNEREREKFRAEAHEWKLDLGYGFNALTRYYDGRWDAGGGILISARAAKGLWLSDDIDRRLSIGIRPEVSAGGFFLEDAFVLLPGAKAILEWSYKSNDGYDFSGIEIAGGYAGRFDSTESADEYENGWSASTSYIFFEQTGLGLNFYHFPHANDYIGGVSVQGYF